MQPAPLPAHVLAILPDFLRRFGMIVAAVAALVAARLLRHPRYAALIIPLWHRITRAGRRFERLTVRLAAGKLRKPHRSGRGGPRATALPTGRGWLVAAIGYEAAGCASQLTALLAEPGVVELLALVPAAGRILRPLCRMLGVGVYAIRSRPVRPTPVAKPKLEFVPPGPLAFRSHGYTWYEVPTPPLKTA